MLRALATAALTTTALCALIGCGSRAAPALDGSAPGQGDRLTVEGTPPSADRVPPERDDGPTGFCEGGSRAVVNQTVLTVKEVLPHHYESQASWEGAAVEVIAEGSGASYSIMTFVVVPLKQTVTDVPLPRTVPIGPPAGLEATLYLHSPPNCSGVPGTCITGLLGTPHDHSFSGTVTLAGTDYRSPCQLSLCLSASGVNKAFPSVHAVQLYIPAVTIPFWRAPGSP